MVTRLEIQETLEELLGSPNVYFQPPPNVQMKYPAIVYQQDYANSQFASNVPYRSAKRYLVTVIDRNPDSLVPDKIANLPMSSFSRQFVSENLNHSAYNVYF